MSTNPEKEAEHDFHLESDSELESETILFDESGEIAAQESVFGDEELPEMSPNLSDGSTKVMTNEALKDMGLQVPAWRAGELPPESFDDQLNAPDANPEFLASEDDAPEAEGFEVGMLESGMHESDADEAHVQHMGFDSNAESHTPELQHFHEVLDAQIGFDGNAEPEDAPLESPTDIVPPNNFAMAPANSSSNSSSNSPLRPPVVPGGGLNIPTVQPQEKLDFSGLNVGSQPPRPAALPLPSFETLAVPTLVDSKPKPATAPLGQVPVLPVAVNEALSVAAKEVPTDLESPTVVPEGLSATSAMPAARAAVPRPVAEVPLPSVKVPAPVVAAQPVAVSSSPAKPSPAPPVPSDAELPETPKPSLLLTLLISYASAVTLALLYLLMSSRAGAKPHHLESLPDITPESPKELSYVPSTMELAPGHSLHLGDSQRFGNIQVEPLRVTYEPLEFRHYTGNEKKTRPASPPVLKLWLRLTNVSTDQTIIPLDAPLLLKWVGKQGEDFEYTNQYLFPTAKREQREAVVSLYRMPVAFDWDLVGQNLGQALAPGESTEMFIPSTDDGTAEINAPTTWRVQLRKGFSTQGQGVTTMFEVQFNWDNIERHPA